MLHWYSLDYIVDYKSKSTIAFRYHIQIMFLARIRSIAFQQRVTVDDVRDACPDELKVCEEHENNCKEDIQLLLRGELKGLASPELKAVVKCYAFKGVSPARTEL